MNLMKLFTSILAGSIFALFVSTNVYAYVKPKKATHLYVAHYENVLGTSMELKISAVSPTEAANAEAAVLNEISRMGKILSAYDPISEFSQWLKTSQQPIHVSAELFEVLSLFDQWRIRTDGA